MSENYKKEESVETLDLLGAKERLPVILLSETILFPGILASILISNETSMYIIDYAKQNSPSYVLLQNTSDNIGVYDVQVSSIGVLGKIIQTMNLANNTIKILIEVKARVKVNPIDPEKTEASYEIIRDEIVSGSEASLKIAELLVTFSHYVQLHPKINESVINSLLEIKDYGLLTYSIASHVTCKSHLKQEILEITNLKLRITRLIEIINNEISFLDLDKEIQGKVKRQIEKNQKDYFLNEQIKVIQKEINGHDDKDIQEFESKLHNLPMLQDVKEKASNDLKKLKSMNPMAGEFGVLRGYLDVLLSMPWGVWDKTRIDINRVSQILDQDHYGLEKVKERVIEYLAVLKRTDQINGPILCFVGPPGVGKTSLVKSIANAIGRKYIKFSLGGVRDEAEIRGHRRTYIGAMPGKIISSIKKVKTNNPVLLLDEIDKMSSDFKGDPASALLEVLDPEQNKFFADHYLDVEYDLSKVVFIATANSYNLPRPLLDRLEIIQLSGYTEEEKLQIAIRHLIPKQFKFHGLKKNELEISKEAVLHLIRYYTKESGVRALEKEISALCRKILKLILVDKNIKSISITSENLAEYLGVKKYKFGIVEESCYVGACAGLSYSEVGGDLLLIESALLPGKGEMKITGKLGDVMQESMQAAFSLLKSRSAELKINPEKYKDNDIHLHVPEGAVPKDGPSAGIAIFTSLVSLLTNVPVKNDIAMTGEITLRGKVLPIGGLKEKLLGAARGGIKTVVIPTENQKDLSEIPNDIKSKLNIIAISQIESLYDIAFAYNPIK